MVFHRRVNPSKQFINQVLEISDRVDALETQPSGNIVIRETLSTTDPNTGVATVFGTLPSGETGFQPFVYDLTPPPVATQPIVTTEPGVFVITWNGALQGDIPRDFVRINIIGHKMNGAATVSSTPVGTITNPLDIKFVTTDVAAVGETWQFSFESEDYNANRAVWGPRSASVTMQSYITDAGINQALTDMQDDITAAETASSNAQSAAAAAETAAATAEEKALLAANIAGGKGQVWPQNTAPVNGRVYDWTGTANASTSTETTNNSLTRTNVIINPKAADNLNYWLSGGTITRVVENGKTWVQANANTWVYAEGRGVVGKFYAAIMRVKGTSGTNFTTYSTDNVYGPVISSVSFTIPASGEMTISAPAAMAVSGTGVMVGIQANASVKITDVLLEEVSAAGQSPKGAYFDGDTYDERQFDLWIDTTNGANTPKRWTGSTWVAVTDKVAQDAASAAATAQTVAGQAQAEAVAAAEAAGQAQTTANGKNRIWYLGSAPTGTNHKQDDIWFNTAADNRVSQWNATNSSWDVQLIGNSAILANLDAGKITVGTLLASVIGAKSITTDKLVITSTDNLIMEGDFSGQGASWELGTNKTINATGGRGGTKSFRVTGTTTTQTSLNKVNKIAISSEERFRTSFFVKSTAALAANTVRLRARAYVDATSFADVTFATNSALVANTWTNVTGTSPVFTNNVIALEFYLEILNNATGTITDIDYVGVTRAADAALIIDGALNAKTITGPLIQTDDTPIDTVASRGVKWTTTGIKAYNTSGQKTFDIAAATGDVTATGKYSSGTTPEEGAASKTVRVTMGIISFQNWTNAPGLLFESYDSSNATTTPAGFIFYYLGGMQLRSSTPSNVWSQFRNDSYIWVKTDGIQITGKNSGYTNIPEVLSNRTTFETVAYPGTVSAPANLTSGRLITEAYPTASTSNGWSASWQTRADGTYPNSVAFGGVGQYNATSQLYEYRNQFVLHSNSQWNINQIEGEMVYKSQLIAQGKNATVPYSLSGRFTDIEFVGGTNAMSTTTTDASLKLRPNGAFIEAPGRVNYLFATSDVVGFSGKVQINGSSDIKYRRAEYVTNNFTVGAGALWDSGPATLDTSGGARTMNNDFSEPGPISGSIRFTKAGYYAVSCTIVPISGAPGNGWTKLVFNSDQNALLGMDSVINGQKHESHVVLNEIHFNAGDYVRALLFFPNQHNINVRWRIVASDLWT